MNGEWQRLGTGKGLVWDWELKSASTNAPSEAERMQIEPFGPDGLSFIYPADRYRVDFKFNGKDYEEKGPNVEQGSTTSARRIDSRTEIGQQA